MNNCTRASLFSVIVGGLLVTFLLDPNAANDAVKAENTRLIQDAKDKDARATALQDKLVALAMASKDQLDQATAELAAEKKRLSEQCPAK